MITKDTKLCISLAAHAGSFGTLFHNYLYEKLNLDYIYKSFGTNNIKGAIEGIRALGIRGSAVSMPYKVECMEFLDELDISAKSVQSVNTIVNDSGKLVGYNTDYKAVEILLKENQIDPNITFVVRGNGGMARALLGAFYNNGMKNGTIVSRNRIQGEQLARNYGYKYQHDSEEFEAQMLINATSIGMTGKDSYTLAFSEENVQKASIIWDVVALPPLTPLIKIAEKYNKKNVNGAEIAVLQSLEQFILYTGVRPDADIVKAANNFARDFIEKSNK